MTDIPENRLMLTFPDLPRFKIKRESAALIIVDMQKADAHPDFGLGAKAKTAGIRDTFAYHWKAVQAALENQKCLLEACRKAGIQVNYTRIATQTRTARDVGRQHRNINVIVPKDSVDAEILSDIAPTQDDIVISKTTSSPFNSTGIHQLLDNLGVDTLLVCGVVSNGCVEGSVRDASDLGYQVIMIPDACAAVTPEPHQSAITNMDNAFCNCRSTNIVVEEINKL